MTTWIALFRGINVVGANMLPMKELAAVLAADGCRDVKTYIQSGNAVFRHRVADAQRLAARLEVAVAKGRGFKPRVLVLERAELEKALASNPFPQAERQPQSVHLFFLARRPQSPDLEAVERLKSKSEAFLFKGQVFYLHTPEGFGISKLAPRVERCLGVDATARNWRTVNAVLELAKSLE